MQSLARKINNLLGMTGLGQAAMANSLPVVIASDQDAVAVVVDQSKVTAVINYVNSIGTAEVNVPGTAASNRYAIRIQNVHATDDVYLGTSTGVSSLTGWRLRPEESVRILAGGDVTIYAKPSGSSVNVRTIEECWVP